MFISHSSTNIQQIKNDFFITPWACLFVTIPDILLHHPKLGKHLTCEGYMTNKKCYKSMSISIWHNSWINRKLRVSRYECISSTPWEYVCLTKFLNHKKARSGALLSIHYSSPTCGMESLWHLNGVCSGGIVFFVKCLYRYCCQVHKEWVDFVIWCLFVRWDWDEWVLNWKQTVKLFETTCGICPKCVKTQIRSIYWIYMLRMELIIYPWRHIQTIKDVQSKKHAYLVNTKWCPLLEDTTFQTHIGQYGLCIRNFRALLSVTFMSGSTQSSGGGTYASSIKRVFHRYAFMM